MKIFWKKIKKDFKKKKKKLNNLLTAAIQVHEVDQECMNPGAE